jgi:hypothetical protein
MNVTAIAQQPANTRRITVRKITSIADTFDGSVEQLEAFLQDEHGLRRHARLCYQIGQLILPTDEQLTDEEIVEFFKFMVIAAIEEKRKLRR